MAIRSGLSEEFKYVQLDPLLHSYVERMTGLKLTNREAVDLIHTYAEFEREAEREAEQTKADNA